jgi:hypothetical protein
MDYLQKGDNNMLDNYKERIEDYCMNIFDNLEDVDPTSKEAVLSVTNATKLINSMIDIERYESDVLKQEAEIEAEAKKHEDEVKSSRRETLIKYGVDICKFIGNLAITVISVSAILKFEENGTITSRLGNWCINRFGKYF